MQVFISHNKADKPTARLLAQELQVLAVKVWFDEWSLSLGDSISGGIEEGLQASHIFVLLWSKHADQSRWVTAERRAYLTQRMADSTLKIIPVLLDDTPLPPLLSDTLGYRLGSTDQLPELAHKIAGEPNDVQQLQRIQAKFKEMTLNMAVDPIFAIAICPTCGSQNFEYQQATDERHDEVYYSITCKACGWSDWTQ